MDNRDLPRRVLFRPTPDFYPADVSRYLGGERMSFFTGIEFLH
jgi:hypothetical protein